MQILILTETNWIGNIVLSQDSASSYLLDLANRNTIEIATPEYAFYEADGMMSKKLKKRIGSIDESLQNLKQIQHSPTYRDLYETAKNALKEIKSLSMAEPIYIEHTMNRIESQVKVIPYTNAILIKADLRFKSSKPPFKLDDCRIYESILDYVRSNGQNYNIRIFHTTDKEDFDHDRIYSELENLNVELYFSPNDVVRRIYELL
ncbi:MAG: PIN domain-containing protein [Methanosarcinales archaeon]